MPSEVQESYGHVIRDSKLISNHFNDYFANVGSNIKMLSMRYKTDTQFNNNNLIHSAVDSFYCTPRQTNTLNQLDSHKAIGIDNLPTKYIKMTADIIAPFLKRSFQ